MLDTVLDLVLLLVSGSACLYCWLLSRRLKALQDLKKGLGASIVSLSEAISKTSIAAQEARLSASQSADKLTRLLADIDKSVPVVDDLIESIHRSTRRAANETTRMQDDAIATIKPLLDEAKRTANELASVVALMNQRTERLHAQSLELDERAEALDRAREQTGRQAASVNMHYSLDAESIAAAGENASDMPDTTSSGKPNPFAVHARRLQAFADGAGQDGSPEDIEDSAGTGGSDGKTKKRSA